MFSRKLFVGASFLFAAQSILDLLSVAFIVPFLYYSVSGDGVLKSFFSVVGEENIVLVSAMIVISLLVARISVAWLIQQCSRMVCHDLDMRVHDSILTSESASLHAADSGFFVGAVTKKTTDVTNGYFQSGALLIANAFILIGTFGASLYFIPSHLVFILVMVIGIYGGMSAVVFRRVLALNGRAVALGLDGLSNKVLHSLANNSALKMMPILRDENAFRDLSNEIRSKQAVNLFIPLTPKYVFDFALGLLVVVGGGYVEESSFSLEIAIMLVVVAQRLGPIVQSTLQAYSFMQNSKHPKLQLHEIITYPRMKFTERPLIEQYLEFEYYPPDFLSTSTRTKTRFELGDICRVVGDSGSGKTTFIKDFCGVLSFGESKMLIDGQKIANSVKEDFISVYFQNSNIFGDDGSTLKRFQCSDSFLKYCDGFGLNAQNWSASDLSNLSVGQIQRLNLAAVLSSESQVLIFDEPVSSLDADQVQIFSDCVNQLQGKVVILISHQNICGLQFSKEISVAKI